MKGEDRQPGHYSIELLVMLSLLGMMLMIAIPSYLQKRTDAEAQQLAEAFRSYAAMVNNYALEKGTWPKNGPGNSFPPELQQQLGFLKTRLPVEGRWECECDGTGNRAGLTLVAPEARRSLIERMDEILDDGDPASGMVVSDGTRITMVLPHPGLP